MTRLLGPTPGAYASATKAKVLRICLDSDIISIADKCRRPDWLGCLGLVLEHMRTDSQFYKSVSSKWAHHLMELELEDSQIYAQLSEIAEGNSLLTVEDLADVEENLLN